jgi:hypothetical protein
LAVNVSAESFAIVGSSDDVPAIERMEMRSVADQGDTVLFGTVPDINAEGVKVPLICNDSNLEHTT